MNLTPNSQGQAPRADNANNVKPKKSRNRVRFSSPALVKGEKWKVARKNGSVPDRIKICFGWDAVNAGCELDASAFMLNSSEKVKGDSWFIFYGQDTSPDKSVVYRSNSDNFNLPDDAGITVCLDRVSGDIQKITLCLTIYEAARNHLNFGMVKNLYARILDGNDTELVHLPVTDTASKVTSLVVGELYRYQNTWKFCAVSSGYQRDLAQFCRIYGVELE